MSNPVYTVVRYAVIRVPVYPEEVKHYGDITYAIDAKDEYLAAQLADLNRYDTLGGRIELIDDPREDD